MSKPKHERSLAETEAQAVTRNIRVSPRKLNLVAALIRGRTAQDAVATLTFSKRRIAQTVKKTLESAIANAENNHQLDVDDLVVSQAFVGKALVLKRFHARARGRGARIMKPFANLTIVVREVAAEQSA
jgi:large subunit ribosomal protein L22